MLTHFKNEKHKNNLNILFTCGFILSYTNQCTLIVAFRDNSFEFHFHITKQYL